MAIALNRLKGILKYFSTQEGILRLNVCLYDDPRNAESQILNVLLLEDSEFLGPFLGKTLEVGFKESNVIVGLELRGLYNIFKSKILNIKTDALFARLVLEAPSVQNLEMQNPNVITALCPLDFIRKNSLKIGDCVDWHIPENAVMLYAN